MTIFIHNSRAGGGDDRREVPVVFAPAVWEPLGFREGSAEERRIRTLRPLDRTQERLLEGVEAVERVPNETWRDRARHRRETGLTYLLGGLLGLAVVGAAVLGGDGGEAPAAGPAVVRGH